MEYNQIAICSDTKLQQICHDLQNVSKFKNLSMKTDDDGLLYPGYSYDDDIINSKTLICIKKFFIKNIKHSPTNQNVMESIITLSYLKGVYVQHSTASNELQNILGKTIKKIQKIQQQNINQKTDLISTESPTAFLKELRNDESTMDYTFHCQDGQVQAHFSILARYPFFKVLGSERWCEKKKELLLSEFPTCIVKQLLNLLYRLPISETPINLVWLYCLADYFDLDKIQIKIKNSLMTCFKNPDMLAETIIFYYTLMKEYSFEKTGDFPLTKIMDLFDHSYPDWSTISDKKGKELIETLHEQEIEPKFQALLGYLYYAGIGTKKKLKKAIKLLQIAIQKGIIDAQYDLGNCFIEIGETKKGFKCFKEAAKKGNLKAQYYMAVSYILGTDGIERNTNKAMQYFQMVIENQNIKSSYDLMIQGLTLQELGKKNSELTKEYDQKAFALLQVAVDDGRIDALYHLGNCYARGKGAELNWTKAIELYEKAASKGSKRAQCHLGYCYHKGNGVTKDIQKAIQFYQSSAKQGNLLSIALLGQCYEELKKMKEAIYCYQEAAKHGNHQGLFYLAKCYKNGNGVKRNSEKAIKLFKKAVKAGSDKALYKLGILSYTTFGHVEEGLIYLRQAAEQGNQKAKQMISSLEQ